MPSTNELIRLSQNYDIKVGSADYRENSQRSVKIGRTPVPIKDYLVTRIKKLEDL